MIIHETLLHSHNTALCGTGTIGTMVAAAGHEALWSVRGSATIDVVVIHYMSAVERNPVNPYGFDNVISLFCEFGVSSHYLINRAGALFRLVPLKFKAWHCGGSIMPGEDGRRGVNDFSIGIELMATQESGFTPMQYSSLGLLCRDIEESYGRSMTYVGHDQIAGERAVELGLRKEPKVDPGPLFMWERFYRELRQG